MKLKIIKILLVFTFILESALAYSQSYYNKYEFRRKRHEINFGAGASSCLTDLGGRDAVGSGFLWDIDIAKTSYVANFSYIYNLTNKIGLRTNLAYLKVSGDDAYAGDFYRNNRRLNFETTIIESSAIIEFNLINAKTGSRYNLKSPARKYLKQKNPIGIGLYVFAGFGGFFYEPTGYDRFIDVNNNIVGTGDKYKLRPLHTEGQGMPDGPIGFSNGATYSTFATCIPMGFGIKKAFNGVGGIKLEAGYRFTNTDYIDDVSTNYYDQNILAANYGDGARIMSGTQTGKMFTYIGYAIDGNYPSGATLEPTLGGTNPYSLEKTYTEPGFQRGNPRNDDSYMFLTLSVYKKFTNTAKTYVNIHRRQKRKVKASF